MLTSTSIAKIAPALLKAQSQMGTVLKDAKNPFYKSNYADVNSFLDMAVPILNANGITLLQPASGGTEGHFVQTFLLHESGEYISSFPLKLVLNKDDMQQLGSAITYARRYGLQSILGLKASDDDGEATMNRTYTKPAAAKGFTGTPAQVANPLLADAIATTAQNKASPEAVTQATVAAPVAKTGFQKTTKAKPANGSAKLEREF